MINIWVNYNNLTTTSLEIIVFYREIMLFYGRTIQVSELFSFIQK